MQINLASITSLKPVLQLLVACKKQLHLEGIFQWTEAYPNRGIVEQDILNRTLYLLLHNEELVGAISLNRNLEPEYQSIDWEDKNGRALVIHRLAIHPDHQGKGYAKSLVQFAEKLAIEKGFTSVRLDAYSGNGAALRLYERFCYTKKGTVTFPGRSLPFFCFEKILRGEHITELHTLF